MKTEAKLKAAFIRELLLQCPSYRVLHYSTAGAPDRGIVGNGISTRWEFKHATPGITSKGDQELMCMRLAELGHCKYILWVEAGGVKATIIATPKAIYQWQQGKALRPESWCEGFNHKWLVEQVKKAHGL